MSKALNHEQVKRCKLCVTLGEDHVPAVGSAHADVMIIGYVSTAREVEEEHPFAGPSGEILDMMLDQAGLNREQVYLTNVVKCNPPGDRPVNPEEVKVCSTTWLHKELKSVNPRIVVLVGKETWKFVDPLDQIKFKHGEFYKAKVRTYLAVYSPGYYLRRGNIEDFVNVGDTLKKLYEQSD